MIVAETAVVDEGGRRGSGDVAGGARQRRQLSTMVDLLPQPVSQFSLPLDRGSNGSCFFFRGYEWVTGAIAHDMFDRAYSLVLGRCGMSGGRSEHDPTSKCASPPRRSFSLSAMPQAETGDEVSAVRLSKELTAAAVGGGNALHRVQGFLSASGVIRYHRGMRAFCALPYSALWPYRFPITYVSYFLP